MTDDNDSYRITSYYVDTPNGRQCVTTFPRQPHWWHDNDAELRRQAVFRNYEPSDIVILIDEVLLYIESPPTTSDECAQLIRRLLSLDWIAQVCRGSLDMLTADDTLDYYVRYWQQRAAR